MIARGQVVAIGFNLCSEYSQAETNWGEKLFNIKKDRPDFKNLVSPVDEVATNGEHLPKSMLPILPKTIASVEKPCKSRVIANQRSRFR